MGPWSKFQRAIHAILDPALKLQIHAMAYPLSGSSTVGRIWITLGREIIWDMPRDFPEECAKGPYNPAASEVGGVIQEYLRTPRRELLTRDFPGDRWGLVDVLRSADRRLGRASLRRLAGRTLSAPAGKVLAARLEAGKAVAAPTSTGNGRRR